MPIIFWILKDWYGFFFSIIMLGTFGVALLLQSTTLAAFGFYGIGILMMVMTYKILKKIASYHPFDLLMNILGFLSNLVDDVRKTKEEKEKNRGGDKK